MDRVIRSGLWWVSLFVAPLVLAGMELFHPSGFTAAPGMYAYLCTSQPYDPKYWALGYFGPQWWFTLHMIQLPMLGLVSVGLWTLVSQISAGVPAVFAWVSRAATFAFLILYTALDSIGGVGLGRTMLNIEQLRAAGRLTPAQVDGAALLLDTNWVDPWIGGVGSFISLGGSWALLIAVLSAIVALRLHARTNWLVLLLLAGFGWQVFQSHASPHGPAGFLLLALAGAWMGVSRLRQRPLPAHGAAVPA